MSDQHEGISQEEAKAQMILDEAFKNVLSTPSGQRVMFYILEQCAMYQDAFSGDNNVTNYTLGLQAGARRIVGRMDAIDPRMYPKLLTDMAEVRLMDEAAEKRAANLEGETDDEAP